MVEWYADLFKGYSFALACFNGAVSPKHPIVVEYHPHSDDVLTIPGVDAHEGNLPALGLPMQRNFKLAFGHDGMSLDVEPKYKDNVAGAYWAPRSVTGFYDNRPSGPNEDYVIALDSLQNGFRGVELAKHLVYDL